MQDGKDGHVYLLDRDALGGLGQGPGGTDDALGVTGPHNGMWGHPAFWGGPNGAYVYTVESNGYLRALELTADAGGVPSLTSVATSTATFGYTSGSPVVTSNGDTSTSALVWVVSVIGSSGRAPSERLQRAAQQRRAEEGLLSAAEPHRASPTRTSPWVGSSRRSRPMTAGCSSPPGTAWCSASGIHQQPRSTRHRRTSAMSRSVALGVAGDPHGDQSGHDHQGLDRQAVHGRSAGRDSAAGHPGAG